MGDALLTSVVHLARTPPTPDGPSGSVFVAYGDEDDHLRLSVLIAQEFGTLTPSARDTCFRPDAPWTERLEAVEQLLAAGRAAASGGILGTLVDPDALVPPSRDDPWEDPSFRRERSDFLRLLLRSVRSGGWVVVRPWPSPSLASEFEELVTDDESAEDSLLGALAPAVRPLARWLRMRGELSERSLKRLIDQVEDPSREVLTETFRVIPAATARVAERLALLRPPQAVNGVFGPFRLSDDSTPDSIPPGAVARLRETGVLQSFPNGKPALFMPAAIRRAWCDLGRSSRPEEDLGADHVWLGNTYGPGVETEIEAHHHAVEAGSLESAVKTATYYGSDLRLLGFRFGRAAAERKDQTLFKKAAEVYRLVVTRFDRLDAYSWEYFGYNLARAHRDHLPSDVAKTIEDAYEEAHKLAPGNPLFHGRLVGFRVSRGSYDRSEVDHLLGRYRMSDGMPGVAFFGQMIVDGLRRSNRHDLADDLATRWRIAPPEKRPGIRPLGQRTRRFGSAHGTIKLADDFDAPLQDFQAYER